MKIQLTESFQRDSESLSEEESLQLFEAILGLPRALKNPHLHTGFGLRKIHSSGLFEARLGLGLRIAFSFEANTIILQRVGNHDEIRRFLKSL